MRIDLRNRQRQRLFSVEIDLKQPPSVVQPPTGSGPEVYLNWDRTLDDQGHLRQCPVCGCHELFARKDFPQVTGFAIVALAAVVSLFMFGAGYAWWAMALLGAIVVVDAGIYLFTGQCLVCYRCRSEFRNLPIKRDHPGWDLAIGEKHRPIRTDTDNAHQEKPNE